MAWGIWLILAMALGLGGLFASSSDDPGDGEPAESDSGEPITDPAPEGDLLDDFDENAVTDSTGQPPIAAREGDEETEAEEEMFSELLVR